MAFEYEVPDGSDELEIWLWNSIEKKWFRSFMSYESGDDLGDHVRMEFDDVISYSLDVRKMTGIQVGTKHCGGRAVVFNAEGEYEDDWDDRFHKMRLVAIVNIDMPRAKFVALRRMTQSLVNFGGFEEKKR